MRGAVRQKIQSAGLLRFRLLIDVVETPRLGERRIASGGVARGIRLWRALKRGVGILVRHVLGVLTSRGVGWLVQLGAERLRKGRSGLRTRRRVFDLLFERGDLRRAGSAMGGARAGQ